SIIHLQATTPAMKAARKPAASASKCIPPTSSPPSSFASKNILAVAPKIKGKTMRKENLAALDLSFPKRMEVDIVEPERERPGNSAAKPCAIPMRKESL